MHSFHHLFIKELQDLYDAEKQLTKALPKMAKEAHSPKLTKAFQTHLKQTEDQVKRLEQIAKDLKFDLKGKTCLGMEGLVKEGEELIKEGKGGNGVLDAGMIGAAQKVEHYEIAGYGTAITFAEMMEHKSAAKLLKKSLNEEEETDKKLSRLAENDINKKAMKDMET